MSPMHRFANRLALALLTLLTLLLSACGSDAPPATDTGTPDSGALDSTADSGALADASDSGTLPDSTTDSTADSGAASDASDASDAGSPTDATAPCDAGAEGCPCVDETMRACGSDVGACMMGVSTCVAGAWGPCTGGVEPATELCTTTVDEDCDGFVACADADCGGQSCGASPPAPHCVDGTTLRSYGGAGTCSSAACVYPPMDTSCPDGCDAGACRTCTPAPWSITTVDSPGNTGFWPKLVVDAAGGAHVAYGDTSNTHLRYAHRTPAGVWTTETAHPDGSSSPTIALDSAGGVHVVGHHFMNTGMLYAYQSATGGAWTRTMAGTEAGGFPSIEVDAAGLLHMTYSRSLGLEYTHETTAGGWTTSAIPLPAGVGGTHTSLRLDDAGGVQVAYYDQNNRDLRFAERDAGGAWTEVLIDGTNDVGFYPWLVVDK